MPQKLIDASCQKLGVQWLWDNIHKGAVRGGLLSDDMGLGKTIQVASFISALIDMGEARVSLTNNLFSNNLNNCKI